MVKEKINDYVPATEISRAFHERLLQVIKEIEHEAGVRFDNLSVKFNTLDGGKTISNIRIKIERL